MSTTLLSTLSRGYGSWTGSVDSEVLNHDHLLCHDSSHPPHRSGVQVAARPQTSLSGIAVADGGHLDLPKTYLTRKGALMLFTAPDEEPSESRTFSRTKPKIRKQKQLIDLSLKLKTLERLSLSVLQFGDKSYDKESASISDKDNNLFVNFLHDFNQEDCDFHSQPGADLKFYLKDLKRRASCRTHRTRETSLYRARTCELQELLDELEEAWPHQRERSYSSNGENFFYSPSSSPSLSSVRALSSRRVLSSKKLAGSLKSVTYLGRPLTQESENLLKAAAGKYARCKSAVTNESSNNETSQKNRPKTAHSLQRITFSTSDLEEDQSKSPETLTTKERTSSDLEDLNTSKQEVDFMASDVEVLDNEWYENTIKVGQTLKSSTSDETRDNETLLAEAATILSSLVEDEDIEVPFGEYSEEEEDFYEWPGSEQKLEKKDHVFSAGVHRHSLIEESSGLTQPLHPQYLNVMNESENISTLLSRGEHDHVLSRASLGTPFPSTRGASPIADGNQATVKTANVQIVSVTEGDFDLPFKKEEREAKLAVMEDYSLKPSSKMQETASLPQQVSVVIPFDVPVTTGFIEDSIPEPLEPKRRAKPMEIKTAEEEKKDLEVAKNLESHFSERVVREKEEKERKSAKLREEKEKAEAKKRDEHEKIKQEKEEKVRAAEERLKRKAEEASRKKETTEKESKIKLHEGDIAKRLEDNMVPSPPKMEKKRSAFKGRENKSELKKTNKQMISNIKPETELKSTNPSQNPPNRQKIVVQKNEPEVPEHLKEMFARKSAQETETEMEEEIIKMKRAVDNVLGTGVTEVEESEGFTEEDFKAAQEALKEKIKRAEEDILQNTSARTETSTTAKKTKPEKITTVTRRGKIKIPDIKKDALKDREALREQQRLEKQRRLEEARELQQKITMKEEARKAKEEEAKRKADEMKERMESIRQEEEELERAEQEAREQLAAVRKAQREEREARRKAELEQKKQKAIQKREKEKAMALAARLKEQEMLESIADAEMARRFKDEEEARREEEEMEAQERLEAEFLEAQKAAEEEEERLRELERQAEEEAFQRILLEKEEAEQRRWQLEEQARLMREEEERLQHDMIEEEKRLEEERKKQEEEEQWRREQERARLKELQRLEEEARERLQSELEKRRAWAIQRRDKNIEVRNYMDRIRQSQGITEPWTFSYFVKWPKDSYMRLMGADPKKLNGSQKPKLKPVAVKENTTEGEVTITNPE